MRKLSKDDKALLDKIASYDNSSFNPVSNIVSEIFKSGQTALFIADKSYLLKKEDVILHEVQSQLLSIISLLSELRQEGYIYLLENNDSGPLIIQKGQRSEVWINQGTQGSALGEIEYIGTDTVKVSDNKCSYTGKAFSREFSSILSHFLTSFLCPTDKLKKFKESGYMTVDEYKYKIKLCYTRIGLIVSLAALLASICLPICLTKWQTKYQTDYNNKNAITTIDEAQLNDIILNLNNITTSLDRLHEQIHTLHVQKKY